MNKTTLVHKADLWLKLHGVKEFPKGMCVVCPHKKKCWESHNEKEFLFYKGKCIRWLDTKDK
jgi:hypothetical protein